VNGLKGANVPVTTDEVMQLRAKIRKSREGAMWGDLMPDPIPQAITNRMLNSLLRYREALEKITANDRGGAPVYYIARKALSDD